MKPKNKLLSCIEKNVHKLFIRICRSIIFLLLSELNYSEYLGGGLSAVQSAQVLSSSPSVPGFVNLSNNSASVCRCLIGNNP